MSGLFATLNTSKGAMYTQQQSINITSHNIANAGTPGYSRQHGIQQTARPQTVTGAGQVGTGVVMNEIQRTRNIFLDYQIRKESSSKGMYDIREQYLTEIEAVFNEPSNTGLSKLLSEFFDGWQSLSTNPEKSDARTIVAEKAKTLANELNHSYTNLSKISENSKNQIQQSIFDINNIFDQLNSINDEIKTVTVAGNNPNDLMDRRDLLLDELSTKFGINTKNENYNSMMLKPEGLEGINLINTDGSTEVNKLAFVDKIEPETYDSTKTATITYYKNGDKTSDDNMVKLTIKNISPNEFNEIKKTRTLWTDKNGNVEGAIYDEQSKKFTLTRPEVEFDKNAQPNEDVIVTFKDSSGGKIGDTITLKKSEADKLEDIVYINSSNQVVGVKNIDGKDMIVKSPDYFNPSTGELGGVLSVYKDVDGYKEQMNSLAKAIAYSVNAIHMEGYGKDTIPFFVSEIGTPDEYKDAKYENITAENIKVNQAIIDDSMKIQTKANKDSGKTDGSRALAIAQLRDLSMNIQEIKEATTYSEFKTKEFTMKTGESILTGNNPITGMKVEGYFKNSINKLGVQSQEAQRIVKNQETLLQGLITRRASVSGVSMDEEMVNLVQFQHAYQANAKMISTVDELLDVVINGLKR